MVISFGHVYLCGAFWQAPTTGTDSKGGTLIHEVSRSYQLLLNQTLTVGYIVKSSHFTANAGTEDYVYGQSAAKSLAKSNPNEAIENADNHEVCFITIS
jgi:peptidyl-Lys metalloendopeptidase